MEVVNRERALQAELEEWRIRWELIMRQNSRELRLQHGDRNSKFFHASAVTNRRHNYIGAIKDDNGAWLYDSNNIRQYLLEKFTALYKSTNICDFFGVESLFSPCISWSENDDLCTILSAVEIFKVVKSMHPIKAPGPDGMPALFYQFFWHVVGNDVIQVVQNFFRHGLMPHCRIEPL